MHSAASFMPYYAALSKGVKPKSLGLAKKGKRHILSVLIHVNTLAVDQ
jgi:hypothetical protein